MAVSSYLPYREESPSMLYYVMLTTFSSILKYPEKDSSQIFTGQGFI